MPKRLKDLLNSPAETLTFAIMNSFLIDFEGIGLGFIFLINNLKSIPFRNGAFWLHENKVLQLMSAGASLERFGEKYLVFINWSFKKELSLVTYFPWVRILFNNLQFMSFIKIYLLNKQVGLAEFFHLLH